MNRFRALALLSFTPLAGAQSWTPQTSGTNASLRGVSAVSDRVAWASGANSAFLLTTDGGATWRVGRAPGEGMLDFRAVHALDRERAYLLSSGPGNMSRIYKTTDGGSGWTLQFTNEDPPGFFDALAFWDARHGIALGDPVNGRFVILTTGDGGATWTRQTGPAALPNEGAFAASGTCLTVRGARDAWFASGGAKAGRVFRSTDGGRSWSVSVTPIRGGAASAGIFSLAFRDSKHGVAVGGNYSKPADAGHNIALTSDAGKTWREPRGAPPGGYRSVVAYVPQRNLWIAVGASGSDFSRDGGESWTAFDSGAFHAIGFAPSGRAGWAVGPEGRIAAWRAPP